MENPQPIPIKLIAPLWRSKRFDWEVGSDYKITKQISYGPFKEAVQATQKSTGKKVIIECVEGLFDDVHQSVRTLRALILYRKADHPNVLKIIEIIEPSCPESFDTLFVVFEYMMSDVVRLLKTQIFIETTHIKHLLHNILVTVRYMHSSGILLRGLRPSDILINDDCSIKICGFQYVKGVKEVRKGPLVIDTTIKEEEQKEETLTVQKPKPLRKRLFRQNAPRPRPAEMYKAPDLVFLKKNHSFVADIWSVGCIYSDLLNMLKENAPTFLDRGPLFQEALNYAWPPPKRTKKPQPFGDYLEDLERFFMVIGTPSEEDLEFLTNQEQIETLKSMEFRKPVDFEEMFPGSSKKSLDLLKKMVRFNPNERITVDECFEHPFLASGPYKTKEKNTQSDIELDFEIPIDGPLNVEIMRKLFLEEIKLYKKIED